MAIKITRTIADKLDPNGWKLVVTALEGQHGTEDWDVLGGQGYICTAGQVWTAKCVCTDVPAGTNTVALPSEAVSTIVQVYLVTANTFSNIYVESGTEFTFYCPVAQNVILTVGPTQVTR